MVGSGPFDSSRRDEAPVDATPAPAGGHLIPGQHRDAQDPPPSTALESPPHGAGSRARRAASLASRRLRTSTRVRTAGRGAKLSLAAVTERLMEQAPRIPVRDLATLRAQFPGLDAERLADKLISGAARGSATVGAGVGAAAALPVPPAMTFELATETLGVAAVEIKLIAELHEVYGLRAPGTPTQRAYAYVGSWAGRRGVDVLRQGGITAAVSGQLKRELRQRLLRRTVRNLPTLAPFLVGAAIGAVTNRRDTRKLAEQIRADLRSRAVPWHSLEGPSDR